MFVHRVNGYAQFTRRRFGVKAIQNEPQYFLLPRRKLLNVADAPHS
jgi:hypothetical protein